MRFLIKATAPTEKFNASVRDATAGDKLARILEDLKPEVCYFIESGGQRTAVFVVDLKAESEIPRIAEPWFLYFDASVEFHPAMTPEDLQKADLDGLAKKWA